MKAEEQHGVRREEMRHWMWGEGCAGEIDMRTKRMLGIAVALVLIAAAPGPRETPKEVKKTGYIKVEIEGTLLQAAGAKGEWSIKLAPGGVPFSWPVSFATLKTKDLEKTAQRLRGKTVVLTGELLYIPPFSTKGLNPLSTAPPTVFPAVTLVVAEAIREAKQK
jgi:hypothetical protein